MVVNLTLPLYSSTVQDTYIEQPEGCQDSNYPPKNWVLKLNKALYGIKQAPREWHKVISSFLTLDLKFTSCAHDLTIPVRCLSAVKPIA
jgi:hypothetical protein